MSLECQPQDVGYKLRPKTPLRISQSRCIYSDSLDDPNARISAVYTVVSRKVVIGLQEIAGCCTYAMCLLILSESGADSF